MEVTFYGNGVVWDGLKNRNLCKFVKGEFKTSDPRVIELLKDYPSNTEGVEESTDIPVDLDKCTIKELKMYAKQYNIKLRDARTKDEILDILTR
ncbi:MAG: hypothetical protein PF693_10970 [Spirochaetia bacterium]|jgi:hypothetical protein|nr:hypothetical protein [Spirochaetia bacterium]